MQTWLDVVGSSEGVRAVYGGAPALDGIELQEIIFSAGTMSFRFDLPAYPENPPKKWMEKGYNTAQLTLWLGTVREISLVKWGFSGVADLSLERRGDQIFVIASGEEVQLSASVDHVDITTISAYLRGTRCHSA